MTVNFYNIKSCFFLCLISIMSCQEMVKEDSKSKVELAKEINIHQTNSSESKGLDCIDLVLYKEEKILEFWLNQRPLFKKLESISLKDTDKYPVGIFDYQQGDQTKILFDFPNDFYRNKQDYANLKYEISIVEKNDLFKDRNLGLLIISSNRKNKNKCLACPYWMAEIFGKIEVELMHYQ